MTFSPDMQKTNHFYQWLAGFIDGDGYFYIDSKNHPRFEIITHIKDEHVLQQIKQYFPGSLKIRSGVQAVRLRISQKEILKRLIFAVNGQLRLSKRQDQLKKLCLYFDIPYKTLTSCSASSSSMTIQIGAYVQWPLEHIDNKAGKTLKRFPNRNRANKTKEPLCVSSFAIDTPFKRDLSNAYLAGLFDSDGTITISVAKTSALMSIEKGVEGKIKRLQFSRGNHQLCCKITSVDKRFLESLRTSYGFGQIVEQKANKATKNPNKLYHWTFQKKEDIDCFLSYIQKYRLRSQKKKRCFLIPKYFNLISNKTHLRENGSIQNKVWLDFCRKWFQG